MIHDQYISIGNLSKKYNCSLRTLRFYEQLEILSPLRAETQRLYTKRDETKLQLTLQGKRIGLPLREIRSLILEKCDQTALDQDQNALMLLTPEKIADQIAFLEERQATLDAAIADLRAALNSDAKVARPQDAAASTDVAPA